jgi:hypothetical protein
LRKEIGNRKIALAGVIVEGQDSFAFEFRQLLLDARERGTRRNAD